MSESARALACVAGFVLALSLAGCGGSGGPPTVDLTPSPTPTPCTQTSAYQDGFPVPTLTLVYDDFSVPDSGRLDVTLDWTFAASPVGFYLVAANTCTLAEFNARSCNFLIRSETAVKPRKISTPNFNAGNYRWIVANFGDDDESVSLQITLSKGTCPALAAPPAASDRGDAVRPPIGRAQHR